MSRIRSGTHSLGAGSVISRSCERGTGVGMVNIQMRSVSKVSWAVLTGALVAWAAGSSFCDSPQKPSDPYLVNRVWVDRVPKDKRDLVLHFALASKAKRHLGAVARTSMWRIYVDVIRFEADDKTLTLISPQEQTRTKFSFRTWRCKNEAPKGYDLCLELIHEGRKLRLYSNADSSFVDDLPFDYLLERMAQTDHWPGGETDGPVCSDCKSGIPSWFAEP